MNLVTILLSLLALIALLPRAEAATSTTLVPAGSAWRYLDTGVNLGAAWRTNSFDDAAWASGPAPLGYGEMNVGHWPRTTNSFGPDANNKFITTYYRRAFQAADPSAYSALNGRLFRDDGAVVYLNGVEVFRSNLPTGAVSYLTLATNTVSGTDEVTSVAFTAGTAALRAGTNLFAVEIHQVSTNSSDIAFDLALDGVLADASVAIGQAKTNLIAADQAWAGSNWTGVRVALSNVFTDLRLPAQWRCIAHLRYARSFLATGDATNASAVFGVIAATEEYPKVHQLEGVECKDEADRLALGLPARDPEATRVRVPVAPAPGRILYVATNGNDGNPGTLAQPLATVAGALAVNRAAGPVAGGTAIQLAAGRYGLTNRIALTSADSGTSNAPLSLRAESPGAAVISGGRLLTGFTLVTNAAILARLPAEAQGKAMQCNLAALGITDFGSIQGFSTFHALQPMVNLYVNGVPQTLARWPNTGFAQIAGIVNSGSGNHYTPGSTPQTFRYSGDHPARWTNAPDGWLHGYLSGAAYDQSVAIGSVNPQARTITTAWCVSYITGGPELSGSAPFRAFNLLEEIDQPGEWYLIRSNGMLYWFPTTDPASATIELSMLSTPMLTAASVSHLRIEGLVFESSRGDGVQLNSCNNSLLAGCTVRNLSGVGVKLNGGRLNAMVGCDLHGLDQAACHLNGGDRNTLAPGGNVVANCRFRDFGRVARTSATGVWLEGVSNRIAHCQFENSPNTAIRFGGPNHLVEFNEFRNCITEVDDYGVIYSWGNPTFWGNLWRFNRFTH